MSVLLSSVPVGVLCSSVSGGAAVVAVFQAAASENTARLAAGCGVPVRTQPGWQQDVEFQREHSQVASRMWSSSENTARLAAG